MRYGKDFYINNDFVYNFSGIRLEKANFIIKLDNFPNPPKCKLFRTEASAIKFFKTLKKERWVRVYEKFNEKWYETFYQPSDNRFYSDFGCDTKIEE